MNNIMQDALKKAGINADDFKGNENLKFSKFPIITKWRSILSESDAMDKFIYKRSHKSALLENWLNKQEDRAIINFLRKNKDRVYILPPDMCQKYCECWIGYNTKYQRFVIRMNRLAYNICPYATVNSYASHLARSVYEEYELNRENKSMVDSIDYTDIINKLIDSGDKTPEIIRHSFTYQTIIPVEYFDPIVEINSLVSGNLITAESTNLDTVKKQLDQIEDSDQVLSNSKLHKNVIDLYCSFNNIRAIDPYGIGDKSDWLNLVFAKDVNGTKKKDKSFFIVI